MVIIFITYFFNVFKVSPTVLGTDTFSLLNSAFSSTEEDYS